MHILNVAWLFCENKNHGVLLFFLQFSNAKVCLETDAPSKKIERKKKKNNVFEKPSALTFARDYDNGLLFSLK